MKNPSLSFASQKLLPLAALAFFTAITLAQSAILVDESFNYAAGSITGQNGGVGFSAPYTGAGTVNTPGLTYPSIVTSGNRFTTNGANAGAFRLLSTPIDVDNGTVYVRFLASRVSANPDYAGLSFFSGGTATEELFLGERSGSDLFGADVTGVGNVDSTVPVTTATTLLVYRLNFTAAGDTLDLFVNPSGALPATPNATLAIAETAFPANFTGIRFQSGNTTFNFDEFRVSTTAFEALPEPGRVSLLLFGAGGLLLRRRRS